MFLQLREHLHAWQNDPAIKAILIKGNGEKAFCAGGDIRALYENKSHGPEKLAGFFELEYSINQMIFHYQSLAVKDQLTVEELNLML